MPNTGVVKVKLPTGIFECTLLGFDKENETVEVFWSNGQKRTHKWSSIIWGDMPKGSKSAKATTATITKPVLPAKQPQKPAKPKATKSKPRAPKPPFPNSQSTMAYYGASSSFATGTHGITASHPYLNPYYQLYNGQPPPMYSPYPNAASSNQVLVPAQALKEPLNGGGRPPNPSTEMPKSFPLTRVDGGSSASSDVDVSMTSHADEGKQNSSMDGSIQA